MLNLSANIWKNSKALVVNSRGASNRICTLWNRSQLDLIASKERQSYILTRFWKKEKVSMIIVINI